MRVSMWMALAGMMVLGSTGCTDEDKSDGSDEGTDDGDTTPDTDDTVGETETGDTAGNEPLEVAALGFEYVGVWNQDTNTLEPYLFPDIYGTIGYATPNTPVVYITLANLEYFSSAGEPDEDMYCTIGATFEGQPADVPVEAFDYDAGRGSTGQALATWGMLEGKLSIYGMSERCSELDPAVWPGGDPMALLDGMHFGLGFGPMSPYVEETLSTDNPDWDEVKDAYISQFIAINHPGDNGGVEFVGYDWNGAFLVETDFNSCGEFFYYGEDGELTTEGVEICGELQVNVDDLTYVLGDSNEQPIHAYQQGFSLWLEDTPNLDLNILKDGA